MNASPTGVAAAIISPFLNRSALRQRTELEAAALIGCADVGSTTADRRHAMEADDP